MNANPLPSQEIDEQEPSRPDVPSQPQEPASKEAPQCPPDICQIQNAEQQEFEQPSRNFESQMVKRDAESETLMEPFHSSTPGKRFLALSKEEQMMLRRAHQNICHPSPNQLSAALRNQGARSDRTQAVFDMPCEVCAFKQQPKIARPCTIKHELGFSDKVLVFGKSSRLPGSITSSVNDTFLASADRDDAQGVAFRKSLDFREKARRTRPDRVAYQPGEWVMMWQPEKPTGYWFAPLKVVNQESHFSIWATQIGKLYRRAPEHVRPLCTSEARMIPEDEVMRKVSQQPILLCCEDVVMHKGLSPEELQDWTSDDILLATTEKKQRTEVKLTTLNAEERKAFEEAKDSEIQNWLKTGTVSKVLRSKLAPEQILRAQLADALTKIMEATFLRETLRKGRYCLHDESEVLKDCTSAVGSGIGAWIASPGIQKEHVA
ncbi:unnamed protein product, partial [Cladocopium goreaui]